MFAVDRLSGKKPAETLPKEPTTCLPGTPSCYPGFLNLLPCVHVMILENIYPDLLIMNMNGSIGTVVDAYTGDLDDKSETDSKRVYNVNTNNSDFLVERV
jgi:hypothetical protein